MFPRTPVSVARTNRQVPRYTSDLFLTAAIALSSDGILFQDLAATVPAVADGDPVRFIAGLNGTRHARAGGGTNGVLKIIGGKKSILFSGSNYFIIDDNKVTNNAPYLAAFALMRYTDHATHETLLNIGKGNSVASARLDLSVNTTGYEAHSRRLDADAAVVVTGGGTPDNNSYIVQVGINDYPNNALRLRINQVEATPGVFLGSGNASPTDSLGMGLGATAVGTATTFVFGNFRRLYVFTTPLTDPEIAAKEAAILAEE